MALQYFADLQRMSEKILCGDCDKGPQKWTTAMYERMVALLLPSLALLWYMLHFQAFFASATRGLCFLGSGYFLGSSLFQPRGCRFIPLSVACCLASGTQNHSTIMTLNALVTVLHGCSAIFDVYCSKHARSSFLQKVNTIMQAENARPRVLLAGPLGAHLPPGVYLPNFPATPVDDSNSACDATWLQQQCHDLRQAVLNHHNTNSNADYSISVNRSNLLDSSFDSIIRSCSRDLLAPRLRVRFDGELGEDTGGLLRDWFDHIGLQLTDDALQDRESALFIVHPVHNSMLPRPGCKRPEDLFAVGQLLALALVHGQQMPLFFGRAAWRQLLGLCLRLEDVLELDPVFFQHRVLPILRPGGVQQVSDFAGESLAFVQSQPPGAEPVELVQGGRDILVTEENAFDYVEQFTASYLFAGAEKEWRLLVSGFQDILPSDLLLSHGFDEYKLELAICGVPALNADDWRQHSEWEGPVELQEWFWEVLREMSQEQRKQLLQFVTGASRLPPGGFAALEPPFLVHHAKGSCERWPTAHTCVNQLNLLTYPSKKILRERLEAICQGSSWGFGFQ